MKNDYEIRGDITAILIWNKQVRLETIISTSSLDKVKEFPNVWSAIYSEKTKSFYAKGSTTVSRGKRINCGIHRWIMGLPKGMVVDHINHDTLDNRIENLRVVTNSENMQNRKGATATSKSGVRNVQWSKQDGKWKVCIRLHQKTHFFGFYHSVEEAEIVARNVRRKYMPFSENDL